MKKDRKKGEKSAGQPARNIMEQWKVRNAFLSIPLSHAFVNWNIAQI